jgi:hypothetical protein
VPELNTYRVPDLYSARNAADLLVRLDIAPDMSTGLKMLSEAITAELETR